MTSMMFRILRTWGSLFKCNYLKNKKFVSDFFLEFMEHTSNFKHFLKNKIVIANVFSKLQTVKDLVWALSKKVVSEHPSTVNMLKCPKHL